VVVSTKEAIVMIEAGANEAAEDIVLKGIEFGHKANQPIIQLQEQLQQARGKPKVAAPVSEVNPEALAAITPTDDEKLARALGQTEKSQREEEMGQLKKELVEKLGEKFPEADIKAAFDAKIRAEIRGNLLEKQKRIDGRGLTDVRPISCEVGLLPRTHGSALFSRGQTQVLAITTLGPAAKEQPLDGLGIEEKKRFMHHYNFPPFSSGETKRVGSPGRREIGHGALAERAIEPILPKAEDFPYTIRLVSEVLSSSGSTSMASVCASSLSLMDAGIPTSAAVAGIAMGLVTGDDGKYVVLTDIQGIEDNHGDMDFKIAGTAKGITAMQMDTKLKGVSLEVVAETLPQARDARLFILEKMQQTISASRPEMSKYAPRMYKITIDPDKIGAVIGTGGKTIRAIIEQTKTTIDVDNDGTVVIGAVNEESARKAIDIIESLTKEIEVGTIYTGKVSRILNFGAMVEIAPGKDGLVHISELAGYRVARVEDEVKIGDEVTVKVIGIDDMGRVNLSRRAVLDNSDQAAGDRAQEGPSKDYPFKRSDSRPPRNKGDYNNRGPNRGPRR